MNDEVHKTSLQK